VHLEDLGGAPRAGGRRRRALDRLAHALVGQQLAHVRIDEPARVSVALRAR
jgi:hypothetical protein